MFINCGIMVENDIFEPHGGVDGYGYIKMKQINIDSALGILFNNYNKEHKILIKLHVCEMCANPSYNG